MSVKIDKSRLNTNPTMFNSSKTGGHLDHNSSSRTTENCTEYFQSWNSRVSFPPENRLSSESPVCRTMRPVVSSGGECENVYKNTNSSQKFNNRLSSSSSVISSQKESNSMLDKSIGNVARLLVKSSSSSSIKTDHCSHYNSKFICPKSSSSLTKILPSSTAHCTMSRNHHHWSSQFGIVLVAILLLSSFSSTTVMCVPIGDVQQQRGMGNGNEEGSSKIVEYSRKLNSQEPSVSTSQSHGQSMYLPDSLFKNEEDGSRMVDKVVMKNAHLYHSSIPTQSNYHQNLKKTSIQKPLKQQHHKDISRSVHLQENDPEDDSDEMDNEMLPPSQNSQFERARAVNDGPIILRAPNDDEDDDVGAMDQLPSSTSSNEQWETVIDPHLYVLTEWGNPNAAKNVKYLETGEELPGRQLLQKQGRFSMFRQQRKRRNSGSGPSLSIVNPLDVLRQRLLLEIARRRMRQSHNQIIANEEILRKIGRR